MRPVISSEKHYVQNTEFNTASGAVTTISYAIGVHVQDKDLPTEVVEGASVKAVFIELWLQSDVDAVTASYVVIVEKALGTVIPPTFTNMTTLNAYLNKKNILFTSQGLLADQTSGNPTPVLRQWIKIPRGKQRMGLGDKIRLNIAAIGTSAVTGCTFCTYKSYT